MKDKSDNQVLSVIAGGFLGVAMTIGIMAAAVNGEQDRRCNCNARQGDGDKPCSKTCKCQGACDNCERCQGCYPLTGKPCSK